MRRAWIMLAGAAGAYWLYQRLQPEPSRLVLNERVVVISGASSGIGRAYANAFARRGAKVVLAARRDELLEAVRAEIAPYAADALAVPTDVTDDAQLQNLVDTTLQRFGQIDVLVNSAGIDASGPLHNIPPDSIRRMIDTNLSSALCLIGLCLPSMLAHGSGRIVNVASVAGAIATPYYASYSASKHGIIALSDALRRELDGTGIEVVSVLPYWTYSEIITPEVAKTLVEAGYKIDSPEHVAQRTIEGLADGKREIYFGGPTTRAAIWLERHFPALMSLVWRAQVTPSFIETSRAGRE